MSHKSCCNFDFHTSLKTLISKLHKINVATVIKRNSKTFAIAAFVSKCDIILVVNSGSALNLDEVEPYVDAILYAWYLGEQGGNALAEIIFGDANPSGKLPFTIPRSTDQLPDYKNYSMKKLNFIHLIWAKENL